MTRRQIALLAAGIAGFVAVVLLFARWNEASSWNYRLGRAAAVSRARSVAAEWGIDARNWRAVVGTNERSAVYLESRRGIAEVQQLSRIETVVALKNPSRPESVRVRFDRDGNVLWLQLPTRTAPTAGDARRTAEQALRRIGVDLSAYRLQASVKAPNNETFRWERAVPAAPELTFIAEAQFEEGRLRRLVRTGEVTPTYLESLARGKRISNILRVVRVLFFVLALGLLVRAMVRRRLQSRMLRRLLLGAFLLLVCLEITAPTLSSGDFTAASEGSRFVVLGHDLGRANTYLDIFLQALFLALLWGTLWAAGHGASHRAAPDSAADVEELLRGRLTRSHGASMLAGFATAGVVAAIPYLVAATRLFGDVFLLSSRYGLVARDLPLLLDDYVSMSSLVLAFAFTAPLLLDARRLGKAAPLVAVLAVAAIVTPVGFQFTIFAGVVALLTATALFALYRSYGLIGVLTAGAVTNLAAAVAMLLSQPSPAVRGYGVLLAVAALLVAAASAVLAIRGRESVRFAAGEEDVSSSERERMQAEFDFARQAQEKMLPAAPPKLRGVDIDGICRPARQVGGDLYDFIPLRDGGTCIVVADVCGKGVPASLYMTMVKGLLLAAADFSSDPLELAAEVNAGLHAMGQRNVFVTMFLGVLDAEGRSFRYVRAGHNPAYLFRRATGDIASLAPKGMALGLVSPKMFRLSTKIEAITLEPGDGLFIYSDGVTEAMNAASDEFGDDRLQQVAREAGTSTARQSRDRVVAEVDAFVGSAPAHDDLTLVVVRAA